MLYHFSVYGNCVDYLDKSFLTLLRLHHCASQMGASLLKQQPFYFLFEFFCTTELQCSSSASLVVDGKLN